MSTSIEDRVEQSVESSLKRLKTDYLDCLLLHNPYEDREGTHRAWRAMESLVPHKVRSIGLSNADLDTLEDVYTRAPIRPAVVQNLCTQVAKGAEYPADWPPGLPLRETPFDRDVRAFRVSDGIVYQP